MIAIVAKQGWAALLAVLLLVGLSGCRRQTNLPVKTGPTRPPRVSAPIPTPTMGRLFVDSDMTLEEAIAGKRFPKEVRKDLVLVNVRYLGYDGWTHQGQLVVHKDLETDVRAIFEELWAKKFPIEKVIPVNAYDWSDGRSMDDNNTSAFNYRKVSGRKGLSNHAFGRAIDLNPLYNPCIRDGKTYPRGSRWNATAKGTVTDGPVVKAFEKRGWRWGGRWTHSGIVDYQHFEKLAPNQKPAFY